VIRPAIIVLLVTSTAVAAPRTKHRHGSLVIVIDRASMPGDAAKSATTAAVAALHPTDDVAVITYGVEGLVFTKPKPARKFSWSNDVAPVQARGDADQYAALKLAHDILSEPRSKHHAVLLSDGPPESIGVAELLLDMHYDGITVSMIGVGDADVERLTWMADAGGGQLYMSEVAALSKWLVKDVVTALPR
jgi:hypothetical protein